MQEITAIKRSLLWIFKHFHLQYEYFHWLNILSIIVIKENATEGYCLLDMLYILNSMIACDSLARLINH